MTMRSAARGFTLIELLVTVAIVGVLLAVGIPLLSSLFEVKRIEGTTAEMMTDLQLARTEAVARNASVRVTFVSSACYVIHPTTTSSPTCSDTSQIKTVQLVTANGAQISSSPAYVEFNSKVGTASAGGSITIANAVNNKQLVVTVSTLGQVKVCSPSGSIKGYSSC